MANSTPRYSITANVVTAPELRFTPNGTAACSFRAVQVDRVKSGDSFTDRDPGLFFRVTIFGTGAENAAASEFPPGTRLMLDGSFRQEKDWTDRNGEHRRGGVEFIAEEVSVSTAFKTVTVGERTSRSSTPSASTAPDSHGSDPWATTPQPEPSGATAEDPWATTETQPVADPWAS